MKTTPTAPDAEKAIIGCLFCDPVESLPACQEEFKTSDFFYDLRHKTIYDCIVAMSDNREMIDFVTINQKLKDANALDAIGGTSYLTELLSDAPSPSALDFYLPIVREKLTLRTILKTCAEISAKIHEPSCVTSEILDEFERAALAIRQSKESCGDIRSLVFEAIAIIEEKARHPGKISGMSTGLYDLDKLTDGIHPGEMIVAAGFPSTGKTALSVGIAFSNALENIPAAVFSAEMRPAQIVLRSLCSDARVNHRAVTEFDCTKLTSSVGRISKIPMTIVPASGFSIGQLSATARRLKQKHGIKVIVIDYIQLITGVGENREQEISSIAKGIKSIALELDCAVIALSQLTDDGKLRESRATGHAADSIWKIENDGEWKPLIQPVKLCVTKCRDGEVGNVDLIFRKEFTRFENATN